MAKNALVKNDKKAELTTTPERTRGTATFTPRVDILENENELVLLADLPGVKPDGVDVRYENGELVIEGRCEPRHDGSNYLFTEYEVGDFYRTFTLGQTFDADRITAELRQGVLTVHLPKSEALKPKRITVKGE